MGLTTVAPFPVITEFCSDTFVEVGYVYGNIVYPFSLIDPVSANPISSRSRRFHYDGSKLLGTISTPLSDCHAFRSKRGRFRKRKIAR